MFLEGLKSLNKNLFKTVERIKKSTCYVPVKEAIKKIIIAVEKVGDNFSWNTNELSMANSLK